VLTVIGGLPIAAGFFGGWTDRIVGRYPIPSMAAVFVLAMGIVCRLGKRDQYRDATAIINFPLYCAWRAEAMCGAAGSCKQARLSGNSDMRICSPDHAQTA